VLQEVLQGVPKYLLWGRDLGKGRPAGWLRQLHVGFGKQTHRFWSARGPRLRRPHARVSLDEDFGSALDLLAWPAF